MFSYHFKRLRTLCALSIEAVGEYLGLSSQTISGWEEGTSLPSLEMLSQLSQLFTCDIKEFFLPLDNNTMSE